VFEIGHWSPINATKSKKWMPYPSIMIPKSFMGDIFLYIYFYKKTLFAFKHWNVIFFLFSCVKLRGTTKEAFVANAIRLTFEHRELFIHHHVAKTIEATTKYGHSF
jgi:hypothetical protein